MGVVESKRDTASSGRRNVTGRNGFGLARHRSRRSGVLYGASSYRARSRTHVLAFGIWVDDAHSLHLVIDRTLAGRTTAATKLQLIAALCGVVLLMLTGSLGGSIVYHHGAGVDPKILTPEIREGHSHENNEQHDGSVHQHSPR
tara:strand:- start:2735 stop:3166 length:432 start_codon:yes stop_codon:yes gene_type:complete